MTLMDVLDEAEDYAKSPASQMMRVLRTVQFQDASAFTDLPSEAVEHMLYPVPEEQDHGRWWERTQEVADIARGLDNGFRVNRAWFLGALDSEEFKTRKLGGLCELAVAQDVRTPLALLFGLTPKLVNACVVTSRPQLAGMGRLAGAGTNPELLTQKWRNNAAFDAAKVPPMDQMDRLPTLRLKQMFGLHESVIAQLDCSDEEKCLLLRELRDEKLLGYRGPSEEFTVSLKRAIESGLPLERVLWAYSKTHDIESAIEGWDMPDEYLTVVFPKPEGE